MAGPTLINLDSSKLNYYSFAVSLEKCGWSCKNLINARFCDAMMLWCQTKKKSSLNVLNMLSEVNELCLLVKHASCDFRYRLEGKRCNLKQIQLSMWM